jgi:uncharacterized protein with HEPN domain
MSRRDMDPADRIRLTHMLAAARQALEFAAGRTRTSLDSEPMYRRAVVHCIQEIGEAATRVTPEGRQASPGLPWKQIVGMRHRVVHAYFNIDLDLVWEVLARDLRPLVAELEQVLGTESA